MGQGAARGRRRRALRIGSALALVVALTGLSLVGAYVVPPVVVNLRSAVADGSAVSLRDGSAAAEIVPPVSWIVARVPWSDSAIEVRTPDRRLTALVALAPSDADADAAIAELSDATAAPVRVETLTSGRTVRHSETADGRIVAVVEVEGAVVSVVARVSGDVDAAAYRPALAQLLAGVGA